MAMFSSKHKLSYGVIAVLSIAVLFIWVVALRLDRRGELTVAFLDVGQGDAIFIEAPNGNQMLIDGGASSGTTLRALGGVMPFWDHSLDVVLMTHPDQDHIGGIPAIMERMSVGTVVATENTSSTGTYEAVIEMIHKKQIHAILARSGERIVLDEGVIFEVLFPDHATAGWETNTSSIVGRLSYGDESFLFTGDSPQSVEQYLVKKEGSKLHTTVLKLGHHGSRTSSVRAFLSAVNPEYAIISAGKDNKYGHPHKEVLDLLNELQIPFLSTLDQGTIVFKTNGEQLILNE